MTVGLDEVRQIRVGTRFRNVQISGELKDFERRLYEGDPTVGWLGKDNTLTLRVGYEADAKGNPIRNGEVRYEIWGQDRLGNQYLCATGPRADASLLRTLAANDTRTGASSFENFWAEVDKAERAKEQKEAEQLEAGYDRLHFAIKRDLGQHMGGRKRLYPIADIKPGSPLVDSKKESA